MIRFDGGSASPAPFFNRKCSPKIFLKQKDAASEAEAPSSKPKHSQASHSHIFHVFSFELASGAIGRVIRSSKDP